MSKNAYVLLVAAMTACGGLLFGYDVGVISGALLFVGPKFGLSDRGQELLTSAVLVGSFMGAIGAGWFTRRFGGRSANMLAGAIFVVGAIASAMSGSAQVLTMSRLLVGVGIGITAVAAPLYVGEIAPPDRRGLMITLYQLFITVGILVSYIVDLAAEPHWRIMFGFGALPGLVLTVGMWMMPSSPRWLAARGRRAEARDVLERTLPTDQAARVMHDIETELESQKQAPLWWQVFSSHPHDAQGNVLRGWPAFRSRAARRALFITSVLAMFQQFIGINAIIYYAPRIFQKAGFAGTQAALWATLVVGVVNVVATFITVGLVDRAGRRTLLVWGLTGMISALCVLGFAFMNFDAADAAAQATAQTTTSATGMPPYTAQGSVTLAWLTLVCVVAYVACFAFSMGPLVWVLLGELFPLQARGSGNAIAAGANYFANFVVGATFLSMLSRLGSANTFLLFAVVATLNLLFVLFFVPETAGRTLEEIERQLGEAPADQA